MQGAPQCPNHTDLVQRVATLEERIKDLNQLIVIFARLNEQSQKIGELDGQYKGAVPGLREAITQLVSEVKTAGETNEIFHGEVTTVAGRVESLRDDVEELRRSKAGKEATDTRFSNHNKLLIGGFIVVALGYALLLVFAILKLKGVPVP